MEPENWEISSKKISKSAYKTTKTYTKKVTNNPAKALELATGLSTAAATRNPRAVEATAFM